MPHKNYSRQLVGCLNAIRSKLARASLCLTLLVTISACTQVNEQPVSGPITIGSEWVEIVPPKPLKVTKTEQTVQLTVNGAVDMHAENTLELEDGRRLAIDVEVIDDEGAVYQLVLGSVSATKFASYYRAGERSTGRDYPTDRTIVKLRLRSDTSIDVDEILWICFTTP